MDRRRGGLAVLLLAFVLLLAVPRLLRADTDGRALPAPLPSAPPVGSCLLNGGPRDMTPATFTVVECGQFHDGEVAATWTADDPLRPEQATAANCDPLGRRYIGVDTVATSGIWSVVVDVRSELLEAPAADRLGDRGWSMCTVHPGGDESYRGSIRLATIADRPAAFAVCYDELPSRAIDCDTRHATESLGSTIDSYVDSRLHDEPVVDQDIPAELRARLTEGCSALVADLTGSPDPTYGGGLRVSLTVSLFAEDSTYPTSKDYIAHCSVAATDGRRLVGSVVGLGGSALPFG